MTSFRFSLHNEGTPEQHLLFTPELGDEVKVPVAGVVFSTDAEARFRQEYAILVEQGLVSNMNPVWVGADSSTQPPQQ
jgi:hypothetical protein